MIYLANVAAVSATGKHEWLDFQMPIFKSDNIINRLSFVYNSVHSIEPEKMTHKSLTKVSWNAFQYGLLLSMLVGGTFGRFAANSMSISPPASLHHFRN